jgi:hypothetical protein
MAPSRRKRKPIKKRKSIPPVEGPVLSRFKDGRYKKIEYLELLNSSEDDDEEFIGEHGYVFRVLIDSELFALKIVGAPEPVNATVFEMLTTSSLNFLISTLYAFS